MKKRVSTGFNNDKEKMKDYFDLSKDEFLKSYSYLTELDYEITTDKVLDCIHSECELNGICKNCGWNCLFDSENLKTNSDKVA